METTATDGMVARLPYGELLELIELQQAIGLALQAAERLRYTDHPIGPRIGGIHDALRDLRRRLLWALEAPLIEANLR